VEPLGLDVDVLEDATLHLLVELAGASREHLRPGVDRGDGRPQLV
jgi:hypothetical protein